MPAGYQQERPDWKCSCGKTYKSQLAMELCVQRKHAPLPEKRVVEIPAPTKEEIEKLFTPSGIRKLFCQQCNAEIKVYKKRKKFCIDCARERSVQYNRGYQQRKRESETARPLVDQTLTCRECGKAWTRLKRAGKTPKYCADCTKTRTRIQYRKFLEKNRKKPVVTTCKCIDCGKEWERTKLQGPPPKRCADCKEKKRVQTYMEYNANKKNPWSSNQV